MTARKNPLVLRDYGSYCKRVARAYDEAPMLDESETWRWKLLIQHVERFFRRMKRSVDVEFVPGQPYKDARQMRSEVKRTGKLLISTDYNEHPVFTPLQNLKLRAVHDYIVHILPGDNAPDFSQKGEIRAYNLHRRLAPPGAWPALFTEVAAQACYHSTRGVFPPQKIAVLPFDTYRVGAEMLSRRNPEWVDRVLGKYARAVRHYVGPNMMPTDTRGRFVELGCGAFGCVLPTKQRGVVLKVTTDATEAAFASDAMTLPRWPMGMVRYHDVLMLPEEWFNPLLQSEQTIYLLWRDEAHYVGALEPGDDQELRARYQMYVREFSLDDVIEFKRALNALRSTGVYFDGVTDGEDYEKVIGNRTFMSHWRQMFSDDIAAIERTVLGADVGAAMRYYFDEGMVLSDVHPRNVGEMHHGDAWHFMVTDPGMMRPLDPKWLYADVPVLEAA